MLKILSLIIAMFISSSAYASNPNLEKMLFLDSSSNHMVACSAFYATSLKYMQDNHDRFVKHSPIPYLSSTEEEESDYISHTMILSIGLELSGELENTLSQIYLNLDGRGISPLVIHNLLVANGIVYTKRINEADDFYEYTSVQGNACLNQIHAIKEILGGRK